MQVVSLNVISEETNYERIYDLSALIAERKLTLHFGILQKSPEKYEGINLLGPPPPSFSSVLGRFEASFLSNEGILKTLLLTRATPRLTDAKFIQATAVTNEVLLHLSVVNFPLRFHLGIISCYW
ncbi:unnamed protein product [Gongylonema pulchrum]|uniref:RNA-directed RNA polymerase n=1 Tax=Gongylonema pulchrum TaxID=637853 RepID=A0A183EJT3_9BILA|nr:unnamed protein product [Gongylonema pulchrum]